MESGRLDTIQSLVNALQDLQVDVDDAERYAQQARTAAKGLWRFAESCEAMVVIPTEEIIAEVTAGYLSELLMVGAVRVNSRAWRKWVGGR